MNLPKNLRRLGAIAGAFSVLFSTSLVKAETTQPESTSEPEPENGDEVNSQIPENADANLAPTVKDTELEASAPITQLPKITESSIPIAPSLDFTATPEVKAVEPVVNTPIVETFTPVTQLPKTPESEKSLVPLASSLDFTNTPATKPNQLPTTTETEQPPVPLAPSLDFNATPPTTITQVSNSVKILNIQPGAILDQPTTPVIIQYPVGSTVELRINDKLADINLIGRTETDAAANLVTQTWYGIGLKEGDNSISAQIVGSQEPPITVLVVVRGSPKKLTILSRETRIPADGRSLATIEGKLLDENGNISKQDAIITLTSSAGEFAGIDAKPDQPGFQVEAKAGEFQGTLRADLKAQTVTIQATTTNLEGYTQLQFETALRPSLVTGVIDLRVGARGTNYYSRYRDFLPIDKDYNTQVEFNSAIFATGKIGEWLFTGAYNSSRSLNEDTNGENRLFRALQFNDQNYPVYGDSSTSSIVTPSIDSVFLRFERSSKIPGANPDYGMWGDYNTEEFARSSQEFTAITRQLHGFKANYNLGNLQITGFYSRNVEGFQRDTIAPDGTSGYYFLSRRILLPGSENLFIELEELNRPGTVVKRTALTRGNDYDIDYDRGTVLFRQPLLRTDIDEYGQILVRRIVATYQYDSQNAEGQIYAGRLQYDFSRGTGQNSWLAATYLQENQGLRQFEIYGADTQISLGSVGKFIAEYAHSRNNSDVAGNVNGQAYRAELQGELFRGVQGRAYYRTADPGFANNATISFVPGQTRYGAQITGKLTNTTNLRLNYDHEDNFGVAPQPRLPEIDRFLPLNDPIPGSRVDNSLTTIMAGIQQRLGKANINVDWISRDRTDRIAFQNLNGSSQQLRSRFSYPLATNLTFLAQNERTLSSQQDGIYPDRTLFGLNWQAIKGVNVSLTQQYFSGGQYNGNGITSLNVNGEQKIGTDTTITGRYSILGGANEMTTQGAIGLNNRWAILPGLRLNLAYEHIFGSFFKRQATGQQFAQPYAFGQGASSMSFGGGDSYSIGLEYTDNPAFQASARYERRDSSSGSNTVISAGALGKISSALTGLARYQQASSSNQTITDLGDTINFKVGLAYRNPKNDKFNALLRYEYRQNPSTRPETFIQGTGSGSEDHTFALEGIYAPNWQWEFYSKLAMRNSTSYLAKDLTGTSTVSLGQFRVTYRPGYKVDIVGETRLIGQSSYSETGFVIEAGYYLTANLRLAAGYAFGKVDDPDFSGTRSAGGPYLGLTLKLNELFDGFGLQRVVPPQQQESSIKKVVQK
ncbi:MULTISPECIES: TonB-dependent receptor [unclassified Anabaena]|uniref:TonB-dependent receptor n=1 Tax=unclassified Anabaena TaxID=2619674 RepID=UPI0014489EFC|nr:MULTISPECIES: TonB-dependent receptor [unclassified Anabaena]MTJ09228.1 TonB-dependent receptor [Anabaena sp. UHCC 0204]MTJ54014.1 TonB-dependent receptor [Anabaena sp. UHCC 0253]